MADEAPPAGSQPPAGTQPAAAPQAPTERLFTQAEVNQIVQDRVARGSRKESAAKTEKAEAETGVSPEQFKQLQRQVEFQSWAFDQLERRPGIKLDEATRSILSTLHNALGSGDEFNKQAGAVIDRMFPVRTENPTEPAQPPKAEAKPAAPAGPPISDKGPASAGALASVQDIAQLTQSQREQMRSTMGESKYLEELRRIVKTSPSLQGKVRPF